MSGMSDEPRKKPGVAFWTCVVLAVLVLYVASIGPAYWLWAHDSLPDGWTAPTRWLIYRPLAWLHDLGPQPITDALDWFVALWY